MMRPRPSVNTPWGPSQSETRYADGVTFYGTAGHGGFRVNAHHWGLIPDRYRRYAARWSGSEYWYEEDVAGLVIPVTFPEYFPHVTAANLAEYRATLDRYVAKGA